MGTLLFSAWHIYTMAILIVVLLIACIVYLWHKYRLNKKFNDSDEIYSLGKERALSLGMIYSARIHCYADSFTTGLTGRKLDKILHKCWEVVDRESALYKIDWLLSAGDRMRYIDILPYITQKDGASKYAEDVAHRVNTLDRSELTLRKCMIDNLSRIARGQFMYVVFSFSSSNIKRGIASWDAARLVVLARMCFDKGYITEQQAWNFILDAYDLAYMHYADWKEVATGYIIGHAMYDCNGDSLDKVITLAENAISNRKSLWTNIKFK